MFFGRKTTSLLPMTLCSSSRMMWQSSREVSALSTVVPRGSGARSLCGHSFRAPFGALRPCGAADRSPIGNIPFEPFAVFPDCRPVSREEQCSCGPGFTYFLMFPSVERRCMDSFRPTSLNPICL